MQYINDTIWRKIIKIADSNWIDICDYGHAIPGSNGPYNCIDTPVRNSAHWCVCYSYLFSITKKKEYYNAVEVLGEYLLKECSKTLNHTIACMDGSKFDSINGLIGQAWAIEGLIYAARTTNKTKYYDAAVEIFLSQEFTDNYIWERVDTDGRNLGVDPVFNHQLWFAASGALICGLKENTLVLNRITLFMDNCANIFCIHRSGRICHYGKLYKKPIIDRAKDLIKIMLDVFVKYIDIDRFGVIAYEDSYHLFNLYGFAILKKYINQLEFWNSEDFVKALNYGLNINRLNMSIKRNTRSIRVSKYSYPYNSPAFEYPYVKFIFDSIDASDKEIIDDLLSFQFEQYFEANNNTISRNEIDLNTLTARLYELLRYIGD